MGKTVKSITRAARKSGAGGLSIVVGGCVLITYMFAQKIDGDEAIKTVLFTILGTIVVLWKVQNGSGDNGSGT